MSKYSQKILIWRMILNLAQTTGFTNRVMRRLDRTEYKRTTFLQQLHILWYLRNKNKLRKLNAHELVLVCKYTVHKKKKKNVDIIIK